MRIGEVAKQAKISASALRYYEEIGLIPPPVRVNGQRQYDDTIFDRLKHIRLAQSVGFSLDEIYHLLHDDTTHQTLSARWKPLVVHKIHDIQTKIQHLHTNLQILARGLDCSCTSFQDCQMGLG